MSDCCLVCGVPVEQQAGRGRPRLYCAECRAARRRAQAQAGDRAPLPCRTCGASREGFKTRSGYCSDCMRARVLACRAIPCASCGEPMQKNVTSAPKGTATCRPCRRSNAQSEDERRDRTNKNRQNPCLDCGIPSYGLRCRKCRDMRQGNGASQPAAKLLQARRTDRDRQAPGPYTVTKRRLLLARWKKQGKVCVYCTTAPVETVDHVLPLALGGTNYEGNLAPACRYCNQLKMDNLLSAWRYGIKVRKWRVLVGPRIPKPRRRVKPIAGEQLVLIVCDVCGDLTTTKTCSMECHRIRMRNRYRLKVGIPLDAPLWDRAS